MKFSVNALDLKRALNTCNEIAPVSSAVAEEKTGVLIRVSKDNPKTAVFMSSDDTSSISVEIDVVSVDKPGEVLVRCSSVAGSVSATFGDKGFDDAPTVISLESTSKGTLKISGGNRVGEKKTHNHIRNFPLLNAGFFIETPDFDGTKATRFPVFQIMDGLNAVSPAASKDASKPHLNCINLNLTDNEIVFVATDGIQIAEYRKAAEVKGLRGSFILGLKFANVAAKLVNPALEHVLIYVEDNNLFLRSGGTVLVSSLINGSFPNYLPYLDVTNSKVAVFPREDFVAVLQGMQPTVDAKSHRMVIEASTKGTATLSTSSISGEAESSDLDVKTVENFVLHFDSTLLQRAVQQLKEDEFEFFFTTDAQGVLLKSPKNDDYRSYVCTLKKSN
jgi:DNA polymerase III sliding clamp (beta) subunit (PCNA family)